MYVFSFFVSQSFQIFKNSAFKYQYFQQQNDQISNDCNYFASVKYYLNLTTKKKHFKIQTQ